MDPADCPTEDAATAVRPSEHLSGGVAAFRISVADGPDQGRFVEIDGAQPALLVGPSPACALRLTDPEVSRRHLALEVTGVGLRLRDLGSTNGTWIEGVGVIDGLVCPGDIVRLGSSVLRVERVPDASSKLPPQTAFGAVLGSSPAMRRVYPIAARLAATSIPVIIEGETGTGKELVAEAMHEQSPRARGPYVVFDCTAIPASLVESELFGHERGAFTGATQSRRGLFELAHGGTLLIDEIGDLELNLQPKLLRAIERSEIRRIGGDRPIRLDVRILAATRRDLDHEVQSGRFRDDLFHRLAVGRIELPPLRHREGDVAILARRFFAELNGQGELPAHVLAKWSDDPWPGNVRELRNAVARYVALGEVDVNDEATPPQATGQDFIGRVVAERVPLPIGRLRVVDEFERRYIEQALADQGGNVSRAAAASGIGRRYFQILKGRALK